MVGPFVLTSHWELGPRRFPPLEISWADANLSVGVLCRRILYPFTFSASYLSRGILVRDL